MTGLSTLLAAGETIKLDNGIMVLPGEIEFITGSDTIKNESISIIAEIAAFIKSNPDIKILRIEGYCSSRADENSNIELSKMRAMAVTKAVIAKGVECRRLFAVGFGSGLPFSSAAKTGDHITAVIAAGKFKKPGIMPVDGGGVVAGDPCK
jgi:outer membrane protein OmpA-like peptidoglycan-associated protein